MKKFDLIDIFFIALILTYFLALLCIMITLVITFIQKKKKEKNIQEDKIDIKKVEPSKTKVKKNSKEEKIAPKEKVQKKGNSSKKKQPTKKSTQAKKKPTKKHTNQKKNAKPRKKTKK